MDDIVTLKIYDYNGTLVKSYEVLGKAGSVNWNTKEVNAGLYIYKVVVNNQAVKQEKFFIHH